MRMSWRDQARINVEHHKKGTTHKLKMVDKFLKEKIGNASSKEATSVVIEWHELEKVNSGVDISRTIEYMEKKCKEEDIDCKRMRSDDPITDDSDYFRLSWR